MFCSHLQCAFLWHFTFAAPGLTTTCCELCTVHKRLGACSLLGSPGTQAFSTLLLTSLQQTPGQPVLSHLLSRQPPCTLSSPLGFFAHKLHYGNLLSRQYCSSPVPGPPACSWQFCTTTRPGRSGSAIRQGDSPEVPQVARALASQDCVLGMMWTLASCIPCWGA